MRYTFTITPRPAVIIPVTVRARRKFTLTENGLAVGPPGPAGPQGPVWNVTYGDKSSLLDAGTYGQASLGDDYLYFCTQTGTAGNAIWKKSVLFNT